MASRDDILRAVRAAKPPPREAPALVREGITYADRRRQFAEALAFVGGRCEVVPTLAAAGAKLAEHPAWPAAKKIVSLVPGAVSGNVDLASVADPHDLEDVDFALLPGKFAVAENGAVWITDESLRHRAVYFLVQHLALVVPAGEIVDNMHQAYERLTFAGPGFGAFLSGPSKTADIEQSLVIGAHGPRSMTVLLVESC